MAAVSALALVACAGSETVETRGSTAAPASTATQPGGVPPTTSPPGAPPSVSFTPVAPTSNPSIPSTTAPSSAVPSTTPPPTPVPSTPRAPTSGVAIVVAGGSAAFTWLPLGWWDGTGWDDWEPVGDAYPPLPTPGVPSVAVSSVGLAAPLAGLSFGEYGPACEPDYIGAVGPTVSLESDVPDPVFGWGYPAIAVSADWDVQPRPVAAVGLDAEVYQRVGESLLTPTPGVDPSAGDVVQVFRVDLDGNGTEEVLVTFERQTGSAFGELGEFSVVYARVVQSDGSVLHHRLDEYVVPDPETSDPPFPAPGRLAIAAIADVNGDGVMEVAVRGHWWEGASIELYEFAGGRFARVLAAGCGS